MDDMLGGIPIFFNDNMTETRVMDSDSIIDKILSWNPCNPWDNIKTVTGPSEVIYETPQGFIMHSVTFKALQAEWAILDKENPL